MSIVARLLEPRHPDRHDAGGGIVIRAMRKRDLRHVMPIEQVVYPRPWTVGVFQSELDQMRDGWRYYVVATARGRVVGYAGLLFSGDDAHVTNIAVDPARRRQHIGTRLLLHVARHARHRGLGNLTLEVRVSNVGAQALYRQFGFAPVGVRRNYYENVEDAIVMWCHDIDGADFASRLDALEAGVER